MESVCIDLPRLAVLDIGDAFKTPILATVYFSEPSGPLTTVPNTPWGVPSVSQEANRTNPLSFFVKAQITRFPTTFIT